MSTADRFLEELPTLRNVDRDEDGFPDPPYVEPLHCGSCYAVVAELLPCTWDTSLEVGTCCTIHSDDEPECDCVFAGDMADASMCQLHGAARRTIPELQPITMQVRRVDIPEWKVA